jgi:hypothetical protein
MSPVISRFLWMKVTMYRKDHAPPHFHVFYEEHEAQIAIQDCRILAWLLPPKVMSLVVEWTLLHQEELLQNRIISENGWEFSAIAPLE